MFLNTIAGIVDEIPSHAERTIYKLQEYADRIGAFITHNPNEFVIALSAAATALFTYILATRTSGLFKETGGLREETAVLAKFAGQQAEDMKQSIAAAHRSADIAERALIAVEGAFVTISDIGIDTVSYRDYGIIDFRISIRVVNSGRTPARNYTTRVNYVGLKVLADDFRFPDRTHEGIISGILGPQSRTFLLVHFFIQEALAVHEGRQKAFIYGWLEYDDIFPHTERHRTEFCLEIEVFTDPRTPPKVIQGQPASSGSGLTIRPVGRYNGHDKDCLYRPGQTPVAEVGELPPDLCPRTCRG